MFYQLLAVVVLVAFAAGCGGVKAETYVMTKERVDQEEGGNGGCLSGDCPSSPAPQKTTRKVYVLEVTKPVAEGKVKKIEQSISVSSNTEISEEPVSPVETNKGYINEQRRAIVIPPIEDEPAVFDSAVAVQQGPKEALQYTVQKDDTLQKIAKKVYGSYSKWIMIYETNKEKIKNPNLVKPGTVLTLPAVDSTK